MRKPPGFTRRTLLGSLICATLRGEMAQLRIGGAVIEVQCEPGDFDLDRTALLDWVAVCARAVSAYMGGFPVPQARIEMVASPRGKGVTNGRSWGDPQARCRVRIARNATADDLRRDWILTHEMLHFAFPSMPRENNWIEEGISTYVEPIARAQAGIIAPQRVWADMLRDMPQGLPQAGDRGLDYTHTWGRTYWGGAVFCLLADVGIRKATGNRAGLRDALRGINHAGGNITVEWPLEKALDAGDHATGTRVLNGLHQALGSSAGSIDLAALWAQLGVTPSGDGVTFDDRAPLAEVRKAILG